MAEILLEFHHSVNTCSSGVVKTTSLVLPTSLFNLAISLMRKTIVLRSQKVFYQRKFILIDEKGTI